ncbi:MAG: hypothetical protein ACRDO2_11110 [Nocardioidaceae bacterium]
MATLRIDLEVRDYDVWRTAFETDAGGRGRHGARHHRIFRAVGDDRRVTLDIDFDTPSQADSFLGVLRNDVWSSSEMAPAKLGTPSAQVIDLVESHEYR